MSNFSLEWFKLEQKNKLAELIIEEQALKNDMLRKEVENSLKSSKAYKAIKLVNNVLTVVLNDGAIMSKPNATEYDFNSVRAASSEEDIFLIMGSEEFLSDQRRIEAEIGVTKNSIKGIDILTATGLLYKEGECMYMEGISRSLPTMLVVRLGEIASKYESVLNEKGKKKAYSVIDEDKEFLSLKRFFMWACLNPRAEVADELYEFLMKNSFRITKQGFFAALRNVVSLESANGSNLLVQFVSNAYNKVKGVWKKRAEDYEVIEHHGSYTIEKTKPTDSAHSGKWIGNLKDLYVDLPNMKENRFTDAYTETFDIRVGKVVSMEPNECSWSTADCAEAGLHFTSDQIHYVGCGDTSMLVLINPMKVVGIGKHKGRCYEYLPIMTVPADEATKILHDLDFNTLELDEDFVIHELEKLTEKVKQGFTAESGKHEFNLPSISTKEITEIVKSLSKMKETISKRVSRV